LYRVEATEMAVGVSPAPGLGKAAAAEISVGESPEPSV
jgi:hypothetical protein